MGKRTGRGRKKKAGEEVDIQDPSVIPIGFNTRGRQRQVRPSQLRDVPRPPSETIAEMGNVPPVTPSPADGDDVDDREVDLGVVPAQAVDEVQSTMTQSSLHTAVPPVGSGQDEMDALISLSGMNICPTLQPRGTIV